MPRLSRPAGVLFAAWTTLSCSGDAAPGRAADAEIAPCWAPLDREIVARPGPHRPVRQCGRSSA
jgi:hypothetical protein